MNSNYTFLVPVRALDDLSYIQIADLVSFNINITIEYFKGFREMFYPYPLNEKKYRILEKEVLGKELKKLKIQLNMLRFCEWLRAVYLKKVKS